MPYHLNKFMHSLKCSFLIKRPNIVPSTPVFINEIQINKIKIFFNMDTENLHYILHQL